MSKNQGIAEALKDIEERAEGEVDKLAENYRSQVMLPIFRRLRLTFIAGMGAWSVRNADEQTIVCDTPYGGGFEMDPDSEDYQTMAERYSEADRELLIEVAQTIGNNEFNGSPFAWSINDIRESDWNDQRAIG